MVGLTIRIPNRGSSAHSVAQRWVAVLLATTALGVTSAHAVDGTWTGATGEWVDGTNWSSNPAVPDGTATFTNTGTAAVANNNGIVIIGTIQFTSAPNAQAYAFTFNNPVIVNASGIINNSTNTQTFEVTSGNSLVFQNGSTASGGTGAVTITNDSGAFVSFQNTASAGNANATIINGGILQFNDTSTAGSAHITNNAEMDFFGNPGSGSSSASTAVITNAGTLTFNNAATASTATIGNSGTIQFNNTSTAGGAVITNNNGSIIEFFNSANAGSTASITNNSGAFLNFRDTSSGGTATITNSGSVTFSSNAAAGGASVVNNNLATISFFNSSSAGNAAITNNGGLTQFFDSSSADGAVITTNSGGNVFFLDTSSGGQATFNTNSGGVFDISGLTSAGTTAGSIAGAGTYFLGAKTLTVGGNNLSTTVSGVISDGGLSGGVGGALTKVGSGTLTLTNTETYTGATTVNGGTLVVDGSTASSSLTTVNPGAVLAGSGTTGNTAIAGGTLAPGSAGGSVFGPLTVQGNLSFTAASTYMIQVSPASAGLTNVTGGATLGGATVDAVFTGTLQKQYKILAATGGVSGTFNPAVASNMSNIQSTLSYDANDVFLNVNLSFTPSGGTLSVNQQNVANAITGFFNATGGLPTAFGTLNAAGLTTASGELGTGVIQSSIKADDLFLNLLLDPTLPGRAGGFATPGGDEASGYAGKRWATPSERDAYAMATKAPRLAAEANRWDVWGAAYGGSETVGGNALVGSQDLRASVHGLAAGADYTFLPDTRLGFALAGGGTSFSLANGLGSGSADLFQVGAFARRNFGPTYLAAALAYGWHDVTTNRTVALAGVDQLQGRFRADTFSGRFEGGTRFATPWVGLTPYAAAQVISFRLPAYAEQTLAGAGLFALNYAAQTTTDTRTEIGLRGDRSFAMRDAVLTLRSRAAWAHDYDPSRAVTALFQALPGTSFVVNGARPNADSALVSAGAEMKWPNGFSLATTFEGEFAGNVTSYAGKGVARYTW